MAVPVEVDDTIPLPVETVSRHVAAYWHEVGLGSELVALDATGTRYRIEANRYAMLPANGTLSLRRVGAASTEVGVRASVGGADVPGFARGIVNRAIQDVVRGALRRFPQFVRESEAPAAERQVA